MYEIVLIAQGARSECYCRGGVEGEMRSEGQSKAPPAELFRLAAAAARAETGKLDLSDRPSTTSFALSKVRKEE